MGRALRLRALGARGVLVAVVFASQAQAQAGDPPPPLIAPATAPPPTTAPPPPPSAPPPSAPPPSAPPPTTATANAAEPAERRGLTQLGVGLGYAAVFPRGGSTSARASELGLVLEAARTFPVSDTVDFGLRFAWGLTAWDRFPRWAKAGYDAGSWTTQAYEDVYNWTRKRGEDGTYDPNTHGLRLMGGFFAMLFLWVGYVFSGLSYVTAVVSPTTWLELDATAAYNFGDPSPRGDNPYLKGGVALMAFIHPEHGTLAGGLGPTLGGGMRFGKLHLGLNGTWSPAGLHGEARSGRTDIVVGGVTIGAQY